jgi:hypothetical protein
MTPRARGVLAVDLRRELPFADASFDAVYCSHVLEHLSRAEGPALLARLRRVLRPGGIVRVAVPDLAAMARQYVEIVDALDRGDDRVEDHEWMLLEMYDQLARRESGGDMARFLADPARRNASFIRRRVGDGTESRPPAPSPVARARNAVERLRVALARVTAVLIGGRVAREAVDEGFFRQSGEVHRWMYDAHSLSRALQRAGFANVRRLSAQESGIPDFARYALDVDEQGRVRKPDSLFIEAQRAAAPGSLEADAMIAETIGKVRTYTMTSDARITALCSAVRHVARNAIPGDIVECGVWRGGSMMAAALTLLQERDAGRTLHLFDTFSGMTQPGEVDVAPDGRSAEALLREADPADEGPQSVWCRAPLEGVRAAMAGTGYDMARVRFVAGPVEETLPREAPERIALLRLDTDWYESTRHELEHLYPRLVAGGVLIIDDYGHWQGARMAVDEYFSARGIAIDLLPIDYTGRWAVKTVA